MLALRAYLITLTGLTIAAGCGGAVEDTLTTNLDAGGSVTDGSVRPTVDATVMPPPDSAVSPPPPASVPCGDAGTCDPSVQVCCVTLQGQQVFNACVAKGSCKGSSFACTSAANCPQGQVCCGTLSGGGAINASCKTSCQGGFQEPQLCKSNAECTAPGDTCQPAVGGLSVCRGGGPPPKDAGPG